jgi:hypothetical protein
MAHEPTKTNPNGMPEKVGAAIGFTVIVVVYSGIAWMAARAAGVI